MGSAAARLLAALDGQIEATEAEIEATERWEQVTEVFDAQVMNPFTGVVEIEKTTKNTQYLVGAEEARELLGELLAKRAGLVGS